MLFFECLYLGAFTYLLQSPQVFSFSSLILSFRLPPLQSACLTFQHPLLLLVSYSWSVFEVLSPELQRICSPLHLLDRRSGCSTKSSRPTISAPQPSFFQWRHSTNSDETHQTYSRNSPKFLAVEITHSEKHLTCRCRESSILGHQNLRSLRKHERVRFCREQMDELREDKSVSSSLVESQHGHRKKTWILKVSKQSPDRAGLRKLHLFGVDLTSSSRATHLPAFSSSNSSPTYSITFLLHGPSPPFSPQLLSRGEEHLPHVTFLWGGRRIVRKKCFAFVFRVTRGIKIY